MPRFKQYFFLNSIRTMLKKLKPFLLAKREYVEIICIKFCKDIKSIPMCNVRVMMT